MLTKGCHAKAWEYLQYFRNVLLALVSENAQTKKIIETKRFWSDVFWRRISFTHYKSITLLDKPYKVFCLYVNIGQDYIEWNGIVLHNFFIRCILNSFLSIYWILAKCNIYNHSTKGEMFTLKRFTQISFIRLEKMSIKTNIGRVILFMFLKQKMCTLQYHEMLRNRIPIQTNLIKYIINTTGDLNAFKLGITVHAKLRYVKTNSNNLIGPRNR